MPTRAKKKKQIMELELSAKFLPFLLAIVFGFLSTTYSFPNPDNFLRCLSDSPSNLTVSDIVFSQTNASYTTVLQSTIRNLRFSTPTSPKPLLIVTPLTYSHVQSTVICSVRNGLQIRTRSGGHDYAGLSYVSTEQAPFVILDLNNIRAVTVDADDQTAWVESGATIGELYYWVSQKSRNLGFPAGLCPTLGVGGHFSGGGIGTLVRKYGLAADNVIDARIVDVNGRILDRESMGEDLFWAIRGGGGASFGVILVWKVNLVNVPRMVTVFSPSRTLDQGGAKIFNRWQQIGHKLSEDLFVRVVIVPVSDKEGNRTVQVVFNSMFLGRIDQLMKMINESFPELGLQEKDCTEMSWIESVLYFSGYLQGDSVDALRDRKAEPKSYFNAKSDYVKKPIPEEALGKIWRWILEGENPVIIMEPHGGRMSEIKATETPYPCRKGFLYNIQYYERWQQEGVEASEKRISWMRRIYENMKPFVSNNPRSAYVNYRDLDLGTNNDTSSTSYSQAAQWGTKYFDRNFRRLATVKGQVDPKNFFFFEQSIPPLIRS